MNRLSLPDGLCICRDPTCSFAPGVCHCGCGRRTSIAKKSITRSGAIAGMPYKYASGHGGRHSSGSLTAVTPKKFYVYMYLRYSLIEYAMRGVPYYVGKGTGRRAWSAFHRQIKRPREDQYIKIIADGLSEIDAFQLEVLLIYFYGRLDLGTGVLRNQTAGGEGTADCSQELRTRRAEQQRARWADAELRARIIKSLKGKHRGRKHIKAVDMVSVCVS